MARVVVSPLDVVKIRMQLQVEPTRATPLVTRGAAVPLGKYTGMWDCFRSMLREEGLRAFWKGHVPAQALSLLYGVVQFPCYEAAKSWLRTRSSGDSKYMSVFVAGGFGGSCATAATYPLDLIRTRMVAQGPVKLYNNLFDASFQLLRSEGPSSLFKGFAPAVVMVFPYAGLNFMYFSALKSLARVESGGAASNGSSSTVRTVVAAASAGVLAKSTLYPLDVIKKRLQVGGFGRGREGYGETRLHRGMMDAFGVIWRAEGLRGFYKGLLPSVIKAAPTTAIIFVSYDAALKHLPEGI